MSRASSPSTERRYGTARVCQLREVPRSTVYARRARQSAPPAAKRGPKQAWTGEALTEQIHAVLAGSPFVGEGYRKVWARLRLAGVRTSKGRLLRLMREAGLLAPTRVGRRRGPRNHDGTITTERPDEMWGTDATACLTTSEGNAMVFVAVDHCTQECVGIHAARPGTRFEALEPLRQGLRAHYGSYGAGVAAGLSLRHDHGSQYLSDHSRTSCASSASARARRSWPRPRATAVPSASSARSRSSCSGSRRSRRWSSCASRCSPSRTATTKRGWSSATGHRTPAAVREALSSSIGAAA